MTQLFSGNAAIKINAATQAYIKNVRVSVSFTKVKEYDDAGEPDVLEYGDATYTFTAEEGYPDSTIIDLALGRTKVDVILYPSGAAAGQVKFTLSNCLLDVDVNYARMAVVLQSISGEGTGIAKGVAP